MVPRVGVGLAQGSQHTGSNKRSKINDYVILHNYESLQDES